MQQHVFSVAATCKLLGVKHVVMSPGSRSAPLVFAFAGNKHFTVHTVPDERSAGYIALGIAQQTQKPVVLFCTSGTATANYYPAIAEAFYQKIPLIVLTADRPEQLLNQQDGQMINQQHIFGKHVRGFYQLPCYKPGNEDLMDTSKTVEKAIIKSNLPVKGPVHINIPLAEPLYPEKIDSKRITDLEGKIKKWFDKQLKNTDTENKSVLFSALETAWISSSKTMLLIGQGAMHEKWITPLLTLQQQHHVVILADIASNKHPFTTAPHFDKLIASADEETLHALQPELLISVGGPLLSKSLKNWLSKQKPKYHFRIQTEPEHVNTYGNLTHTIPAKPEHVLNMLAEITRNDKPDNNYVKAWKNADNKLASHINTFLNKKIWSELHATKTILDNLPHAGNLQLANSSIVRYVSLIGAVNPSLIINSNRGTSGIDGCTSTAVGAAKGNFRPTVLLTGDLAFLYDKNGLWLNDIPHNLRIIVFNNNGGGIFTLIDGPTKHKAFEKYFITPTPQQIELTAQQSGLDYYFCNNMAGLKKTLVRFLNPANDKAAILELKFDMKANAKVFQQFKNIKL